MILGIGSSGPQVAEGWHGQRFAKQLQRTREYVAVVRMALARERVEFHGETLELPLPDGPGKALKLTIGPVQEQIPIYLAAIGPKNTALAGEIADGWIPTLFSPEHVSRAAPAARGRRGALGQIARWLRHRADGQRVRHRRSARARATRCARSSRCMSAGWARASRTSTTSSSSRYGFEAEAKEIQDLYLEGKREEAMAAIPDRADRHGLAVRARRTSCASAWRSTATRASARSASRRSPSRPTIASRSCAWSPSSPPEPDADARACWAPSATRARLPDDRARARRCAARGHDVTLQTWAALAGARRGRGHGVRGRARVPGVPAAARSRWTSTRRSSTRRATRCRSCASCARMSSSPTSSRSRRRWRPSSTDVPCATLIPHVYPDGEPDFPIYSLGARLPRTALGRALWRARASARSRTASSAAAASSTHARAAGPAAARPRPRRHQPRLALVATFPQLEYPRRVAARTCTWWAR